MSIFHAVIIGLIQGITEALPISSSGHLIALPELFGWGHQADDFDVMVHVATLLAIFVVLRKEVFQTAKEMLKGGKMRSFGWKIVAGTIPVVLFGLFLSGGWMEEIRTTEVVAVNLIVWGLVLSIADFYTKWREEKKTKMTAEIEKTTWKQAMVIGVSQALALIPGTSRSGVTMSFGLFSGMDRITAAKFSFLLGMPAIAGAGLLTFKDALENGFQTETGALMVGFITAFFSGLIAMKALFYILSRTNFQWFAGYRIVLGIFLLWLL